MAARRLKLTSKDEISSGTSKNGPWTLWGVSALDENDVPVEGKLKMFGDPALGELREYEVERQVHEKYGESFMLTDPNGKKGGNGGGKSGGGLGASVDDLRARVEAAEHRLDQLEGKLPGSGASPGLQAQGRPPMGGAGSGPPAAPRAAPAHADDDDIPF